MRGSQTRRAISACGCGCATFRIGTRPEPIVPRLPPASTFFLTGRHITDSFVGFGAEFNPNTWTASGRAGGITEQNSALIVEGLHKLGAQHVRIFVPWCAATDRAKTPAEQEQIASFKRTLKVAQESEVFGFISDVDADQRMEIDRMSDMLKELQK